VAVGYLRRRGWAVLARNWRVRGGELDVVCWDGAAVVAVEVKARRNRTFGSAAEQVHPAQLARVCHTAELYLQSVKLSGRSSRVDVVALDRENGRWYLTHFFDVGTLCVHDVHSSATPHPLAG
jgi:putative endonuclease